MQISHVVVSPIELTLKQPIQMVGQEPLSSLTAIFLRLITRQGQSAWGCSISHPTLTRMQPEASLRITQECADRLPDLHPLNIEQTLNELAPMTQGAPEVLCAFDLALHDLLGLAAGMPLYRLLGGYRERIQTSITIPIASVVESVELAQAYARTGFRILKIKGGIDPDLDVQRVLAIWRALPDITLRLDADGGYDERQALEVARALKGRIEMLEQPTAPNDLAGLRQVSKLSPLPVLADQSVWGPESALEIASGHFAHGISIKLASCGGLRCARSMDAIARAAGLVSMVSCLVEPAMLVTAGLSFALSSPNVRYGDLDGHLFLANDPSQPGFSLEDGWLIAREVPGLGSRAELD